MSGSGMKRFWKEASVEATDNGFAVSLDGRAIRTPAKAALIVPTRAIAAEIAREWQAQEDRVRPETMPVTRAANSAIDTVSKQFDEVAEMIAAYGENDLICYRAETPMELIARQAEAWDPLIDFAREGLGASLTLVSGLMPVTQPQNAVRALADRVGQLDAWSLTALHDLVAISGSLVIGFAVLDRWATPEDLWHRSRVDENWQIEAWGEDEDEMAVVATKRAAFLAAERFYRLVNENA